MLNNQGEPKYTIGDNTIRFIGDYITSLVNS